MRSSSGYYNKRLDHLRALAAFLVCFWHFVHLTVPTSYVPSFFALSLLEEGHTGVSLFMTLSGFLFARIAGNHDINFTAFAKNRFLRLAPLLLISFAMYLAWGDTTVTKLIQGVVLPTWPGTAWSLAPEIQFYLVFPFLLAIARRHGIGSLVLLVLCAMAFRASLWQLYGEVQRAAYWSIIGRIDQFLWGVVFGILVNRAKAAGAHNGFGTGLAAAVILFASLWGYHVFNSMGGFYHLPEYPSPSSLWIVLPSMEGFAYAYLIAWYSETKFKIPEKFDRALAAIGTASFSIYIWHWPLQQPIARFFDMVGLPRKDFLEASALAVPYFVMVAGLSILSYRLIESPFLKRRVPYLRPVDRREGTATPVSTAS
jgi:rhamnosyltransferase